ncbi:MAG: hypothetical protein IJB95_01145 [Clostridia bacterium]|nr:hypothetical protein [Clostridia bacterium]
MKMRPVKLVLGLAFFSFIFCPILMCTLGFVGGTLIGMDYETLPYFAFLLGGLFVGSVFYIAFLRTKDGGIIYIKDGYVENYVPDNTDNDGWREEIANIKSVALVGKEEVQKYYRQFNKRKAILIDFGHGNIKYIYAGLFSKRQIKKIMKLLTPKQ